MNAFQYIMANGPGILQAALALLGAMAALFRYSPWHQSSDAFFDKIEAPIKALANFFGPKQ